MYGKTLPRRKKKKASHTSLPTHSPLYLQSTSQRHPLRNDHNHFNFPEHRRATFFEIGSRTVSLAWPLSESCQPCHHNPSHTLHPLPSFLSFFGPNLRRLFSARGTSHAAAQHRDLHFPSCKKWLSCHPVTPVHMVIHASAKLRHGKATGSPRLDVERSQDKTVSLNLTPFNFSTSPTNSFPFIVPKVALYYLFQ